MSNLLDTHTKKVIEDYLLYSQEQIKGYSQLNENKKPVKSSSKSTTASSVGKFIHFDEKKYKKKGKESKNSKKSLQASLSLKNNSQSMRKEKKENPQKIKRKKEEFHRISTEMNSPKLVKTYQRCFMLLQNLEKKCLILQQQNKELKKANHFLKFKDKL